MSALSRLEVEDDVVVSAPIAPTPSVSSSPPPTTTTNGTTKPTSATASNAPKKMVAMPPKPWDAAPDSSAKLAPKPLKPMVAPPASKPVEPVVPLPKPAVVRTVVPKPVPVEAPTPMETSPAPEPEPKTPPASPPPAAASGSAKKKKPVPATPEPKAEAKVSPPSPKKPAKRKIAVTDDTESEAPAAKTPKVSKSKAFKAKPWSAPAEVLQSFEVKTAMGTELADFKPPQALFDRWAKVSSAEDAVKQFSVTELYIMAGAWCAMTGRDDLCSGDVALEALAKLMKVADASTQAQVRALLMRANA